MKLITLFVNFLTFCFENKCGNTYTYYYNIFQYSVRRQERLLLSFFYYRLQT